MKSQKATFTHTPFGNLKELLKQNNIKVAPNNQKSKSPPKNNQTNHPPEKNGSAADQELFLEAMSDVVPIERKRCPPRQPPPKQKTSFLTRKSGGTLKKLNNLIESGEGFIIAQTSEYIEGANAHIHPELTRLLHDGHFTIQDHIDLHGLNVEKAQITFDKFMKSAIARRKKGVLIVHGRGLSSPVEPVLKNKVYKWLSSGPWRKWVIAFASARACDGGAGATYVLLRDHPAKKSRRRNKYFR